MSNNSSVFSPKTLAYSAICIAIATVLSFIKIGMPMGGSITLFSMFFIALTGYLFGPVVGISSGVAYGILQLIIEPYIVTLPQVFLDYPLAFGALGLSGFFAGKKMGLIIGYCVGIVGRYICSVLSGVIFFATYAPEGMNPLVYSLLYNGIYIFAEGLLTIVVIQIPVFKNALLHMKNTLG